MTDEEKAREVINKLLALEGKPGVDTFFTLEEDDLEVKIEEYGKTLLRHKINLNNLREMTLDEVSYVVLNQF